MTSWADALLVARLAAADPHGVGGVIVRAGAGPVRDAWLAALRNALPAERPVRRMPGGITDARLLGGLDLPATLAAGRPVADTGLLAETDGGLLVVPMAERLSPGHAARLAAVLDDGTVRVERDGLGQRRPARLGVILLDEGQGDDERVPDTLADRLAFHIDLTDIPWRDVAHADAPSPGAGTGPPAEDALAALCQAAAALGITSLRSPILAARVARLLARLTGRDVPAEDEIVLSARLVLGPRATRMPAPEPSPETAEPGEADAPPEPEAAAGEEGSSAPLDQRMIEAARSTLPPGLLAGLIAVGARPRLPRAGKAGVAAAARAGRPMGARAGDPRHGRLDLIETLRAAAPWQRLRRTASEPRRLRIRPEDLRVTRFVQRTRTTTIFAVDASGSAALERLAEAKGAVELLLAEAYIRRDHVAVLAFRGCGAELILPPTRALARARRGLSALPGGGGTPLAAGLDAAADLARAVRRGGGTPVVVVLTDGRANIARSGAAGRVQASADALAAAATLRADGVRAILIDTAARPQDTARRLAEAMDARYLPLPYADAGAMSAAIRAAT